MMELGIEPTVVFTRWLNNDTRPLLVCLPTDEDALARPIMNCLYMCMFPCGRINEDDGDDKIDNP